MLVHVEHGGATAELHNHLAASQRHDTPHAATVMPAADCSASLPVGEGTHVHQIVEPDSTHLLILEGLIVELRLLFRVIDEDGFGRGCSC